MTGVNNLSGKCGSCQKEVMRAIPTSLLPALALLLMATHATAQMRQEQRISDLLPFQNLASKKMVVDGEWAALESTAVAQPYVGKVLMCRRQAGVWSTVQTLPPQDVVPGHLVLQGDWLAVSELGEPTVLREGKANLQGLIRLFHRQGDRWVLVQTLRPGSEITKDGSFQFGTSLAMHSDRLLVLMDRYFTPTDGTESEVIDSTLHSYRLRGGSWQLEQVIDDDLLDRTNGIWSPSLSLKGDWLAVGDYASLSQDWQPNGAVHLFRLQKSRWKLVQTLVPPVDSPAQMFGTQVALADEGHLLITTQLGVVDSCWDGKQWSTPAKVEIGFTDEGVPLFSRGTPTLAVHGKTAAVKVNSSLHLLTLTEQGWRQMRQIPVHVNASELALSADTLLFASDFMSMIQKWRAISFLTLADLEVRLGRVQVQSGNSRQLPVPPVIAAGSEVVWQPQLEGNEVPFTVSNVSTGLMPRPVASLSGEMATSFEIIPQTATPALLAPGEQMTFFLRPRNGALVTDSPLTVTFSTSGAVPDYSFKLRWKLPSGPLQGSPLVSLMAADFWQLGQPVHLAPNITGMPVSAAPTYRWLRDGVEMPGQNGAVLSLPEVKPEHAGSYTLEVRQQGITTTSDSCRIVVFDPTEQIVRMSDGELARITPRYWGSAKITWLNPQTSPYLAGITLPTLTILDGRWIAPSGMSELEAIAAVVDPVSQTELAWKVIGRFRLVSEGRKPTFTTFHSSFYAVGDSIGETVVFPNHARDLYGGRSAWPGSRVTASGLPPGLTLHNAALEGTFTKAGIYPVTWRLQDASGAWSDPVVSEFMVGPPSPKWDAGLHVGWVGGTGDGPGKVEVRLEVGGSFSGVIQMPGATRRFAGRLKEVPEAPGEFVSVIPIPKLPGTQGTKVQIGSFPSQAKLQVIVIVNLESEPDEVHWTAALQHRPRRPAPISPEQIGAYNVLIDNAGTPYDERDSPSGTGFMRVTVSPAHTAQVVGTLPDGTGITAACHVMRDDYNLMILPFYQEDRGAGNLLGGQIQIGIPEQPLVVAGVSLSWKKRPTRLYPEGFDISLIGEGWRYIPPPAGVLLLSEAADLPGNAFCQTDHLEGIFRLTRDHRGVPHSTRSGSRLKSIQFHAPLGFFSGQMSVISDPDSKLPKVTRETKFYGLVLPPSSMGGGFYFFPESPQGGLRSHQLRLGSF